MTFAIDTGPTNGALSAITGPNCTGSTPINCTASVTYTPNNNFAGPDNFTYTVSDNQGAVSSGQVSIFVSVPIQPPVARNDTYIVTQDSSNNVLTVLTNDSDPDGALDNTSIAITSLPTHGTASPQSNGTILYTPNPGSTGSDSFTYTVKDNQGAISNVATVNITINTPPTATITAPTGNVTIVTGGSVNFTGSGSDPNSGQTLTYAWTFAGGTPSSSTAEPGRGHLHRRRRSRRHLDRQRWPW